MGSELKIARRVFNAIFEQNTSELKDLIGIVNPNIILPDKGINILHLAIGVDPIDYAESITKLILCYGCNIDERSEDGMTALHIACAWNRFGIVKILLDYGAEALIKDNDDKYPIHYAMENGYFDIVEYLIDCYQYDDACDSPDMYTLKLDKVVVDNGSFKGEYEVIKDDSNESCLNNRIDNDSFTSNRDNLIKQSSDYHTCNETLSVVSDKSDALTECCNNIDLTDKIVTEDSDLGEISKLKFTRNEENCLYSVFHHSANDKKDLNVMKSDNFALSLSPYRHKNYFSTTTLNHKDNDSPKTVNDKTDKILSEEKTDRFPSILDITDNVITDVTSQMLNVSEMPNIIEEYRYEDPKAGIKLVEKRILPSIVPPHNETNEKSRYTTKNSTSPIPSSFDYDSNELRKELISHGYDPGPITDTTKKLYLKKLYAIKKKNTNSLHISSCSSKSSLPSSFDYDSDKLRKELMSHGYNPGPITTSTKKLYLKKLYAIKKNPVDFIQTQKDNKSKTFTVELEKSLRDDDWMNNLDSYMELEAKIIRQFEEPASKNKWREGVMKSSFTYLLLDPRITDNLPNRTNTLSKLEIWKIFINSIFYVGKGKRSRPYNHLYQAVSVHNSGRTQSGDEKIQYILDVWKDNLGVVCLHVFQNVIPVEAYTREAAIIEVLGLKNLKNIKPGNYYGIASMWSLKDKKYLGLYLLYKAMLIFFNEGERQLKPCDIC